MNTFETDKSYVLNTYQRFPVNLVSGKGALLKDQNGKEYIDLASGIAVNIFGACDDEWLGAVKAQLDLIQHTSNLYYTNPCVELAKLLCEKTGMKKVFFANSGAEANECAIKASRHYGITKKGDEYYNIITLKNSFHGRTITTLSATGQDVFHKDFNPLTEGFLYAEANNLKFLEEIAQNNKCCAIMFETVQGEGGVLPLTEEFVKKIKEIAEKYDLLIVVDEVQTGNGRCGKLYSYMNYDISPDIVTTAKGLGGGLPIGATLFSEKTENILKSGMHGSTFGGNPVCCAGAINVIKRLTPEFLNEVNQKSDYIFSELKNQKGVLSVSGKGLMIGIETEKDASDVINSCLEKGVLVIKAKNKVRLLPPLNIPFDQLQKAIEIIKTCL